MLEILNDLYDSEINFAIKAICWDGGYEILVGNNSPYDITRDTCLEHHSGIHDLESAITALRDVACRLYPESVFARKYAD